MDNPVHADSRPALDPDHAADHRGHAPDLQAWKLVLVLIMLPAAVLAGDIKFMFRDYSWDDAYERPISIGPALWVDDDGGDLKLAGYADVKLVSLFDCRFRLGCGMAVTSSEDVRADLRLMATAGTMIGEYIDIGMWQALFFSMFDNVDPWGAYVGYAIKF